MRDRSRNRVCPRYLLQHESSPREVSTGSNLRKGVWVRWRLFCRDTERGYRRRTNGVLGSGSCRGGPVFFFYDVEGVRGREESPPLRDSTMPEDGYSKTGKAVKGESSICWAEYGRRKITPQVLEIQEECNRLFPPPGIRRYRPASVHITVTTITPLHNKSCGAFFGGRPVLQAVHAYCREALAILFRRKLFSSARR